MSVSTFEKLDKTAKFNNESVETETSELQTHTEEEMAQHLRSWHGFVGLREPRYVSTPSLKLPVTIFTVDSPSY